MQDSGDHLRQSGPSVAAILDPGGPSMATKIVTNGPGGPVVAMERWPSDKANHSCENMLSTTVCHSSSEKDF